MNLVVLYGSQGADADAEQLALTEQLFDAARGDLGLVARGQPSLIVGDFHVEPTKITCSAKGISAGLWVDLDAAWSLAGSDQPTATFPVGRHCPGRQWWFVELSVLGNAFCSCCGEFD